MRLLRDTVSFAFSCFVATVSAVYLYLLFVDPSVGQRLGHGWYYLRGYYEQTQFVAGKPQTILVMEQGRGVWLVPLAVTSVLTVGYLAVKLWCQFLRRSPGNTTV